MKLEELRDKKILILGFGKEGKNSYLALKKLFPKKNIGIADQKFDKNYLKKIKNYDLIIKTPGIPLSKIKSFLRKKQKVTSQTEIFFANCPGVIIGVTGTKGKGTTASLIYQILKKGGAKVKLVGNIGKPVFQTLLKAKKGDVFVYELSSHQLEGLRRSPQIAVFLNLFPDHLNYYKNFNEYKKAKENIARYQKKGDFFIYNSQDKLVKEIAKKTKAKKIPVGGKFNLLNIAAAEAVGRLFKVPKTKIKQAIKEFKPLSHRLEFVGRYKGIEFHDDSASTIPEAAIAALEALGERVKTLIVGGSEKGSDYSKLAKAILKSNLRTLIIFPGGTGERIWQELEKLKKKNSPQAIFADSMRTAAKKCFEKTRRGEICLLSPASASFNLFRNYEERGELFKKFVKHYGKK